MSVKAHRTSIVGLAGLVAGLTAGDALAGGFQLREQSAPGLGESYAGAAASGEDASTIWYNPAAMTRLKGNQLAGYATLYMPYAKFTGTGLPGGSKPGDAIQDALGGSSFAFWDYSSDLKFGIGITSPYGLRSAYHIGSQAAYQALKTSLTNIVVNPSIAWRVAPGFSIGGGVSISYAEAEFSQQIPSPPYPANSWALARGDDVSFGFNLGAFWEVTPSTRVGLAYRSGIDHTLDGYLKIQMPAIGVMHKFDATAGVTLPATASFGIVHELDKDWTIKAGVDWTQWSVFKKLGVVATGTGAPNMPSAIENWRDTWMVSLGADYKIAPGHLLRVGTAYEITPIPDDAHRYARVPDGDRFWLSAGYSWEVNKNLRWDIGYAHLFSPDAKIDEKNPFAPTNPYLNLKGSYSNHADLISTGFVYKF